MPVCADAERRLQTVARPQAVAAGPHIALHKSPLRSKLVCRNMRWNQQYLTCSPRTSICTPIVRREHIHLRCEQEQHMTRLTVSKTRRTLIALACVAGAAPWVQAVAQDSIKVGYVGALSGLSAKSGEA